jgi:signal transduction histidine kinase
LRRQTNILQSVLNSMGDGVIVADVSGKILLFNPAAERLIRAGLGTVAPGDSFEQFQTYLSDTLTAYPTNEHPLLRAMRGEIIDGAEIFLRKSDASEGLWLTATGRPLIDEHGRVQGGVVVYTDLSARKLMERQVAEISDREQRRIGQDLHDTVGQELTALSLTAGDLAEILATNRSDGSKLAEQMVRGLQRSQRELRTIMRGLLPVPVDGEGLMAALADLAQRIWTEWKVNCAFDCPEPVSVGNNLTATHLYLIAQEAVHNAIKHARPTNIRVVLKSNDLLSMSVQDDGLGLPAHPTGEHAGLGLRIMRNRAAIIGATLTVGPARPTGTLVNVHLPNALATLNEVIVQPAQRPESSSDKYGVHIS